LEGKMGESENKNLKVNDHRRVDIEGNDRLTTEGKNSMTNSEFEMKDKLESVPEITFSSFIMSLATQALMQLGELPPPPGISVPVDPDGAKQTIDIISMLEEKTRGNVDPNEQRLLKEVLHNIRLSFLAKKNK